MMSSSDIFPKLSKEFPLSQANISQEQFKTLTVIETKAQDEKFIPTLEANPDKEYILKEHAQFINSIRKTIEEAHALIEDVEKKSNQIRSEAQGLSEKIRQEAFDEGFSQGFSEGQKQYINKTEGAEKKLLQTIELFESARKDILEQSREQLIDLVFLLTKKVIHKEISSDRSIILKNINAAISMILKSDSITIKLHPDDIAYIKSQKSAVDTLLHNKSIQLLEDPALEIGGCYVETDFGTIDATIEGQLEALKKEFNNDNGS
ncbi:MAG: FliH/SctL family protein [bacterium]